MCRTEKSPWTDWTDLSDKVRGNQIPSRKNLDSSYIKLS